MKSFFCNIISHDSTSAEWDAYLPNLAKRFRRKNNIHVEITHNDYNLRAFRHVVSKRTGRVDKWRNKNLIFY